MPAGAPCSPQRAHSAQSPARAARRPGPRARPAAAQSRSARCKTLHGVCVCVCVCVRARVGASAALMCKAGAVVGPQRWQGDNRCIDGRRMAYGNMGGCRQRPTHRATTHLWSLSVLTTVWPSAFSMMMPAMVLSWRLITRCAWSCVVCIVYVCVCMDRMMCCGHRTRRPPHAPACAGGGASATHACGHRPCHMGMADHSAAPHQACMQLAKHSKRLGQSTHQPAGSGCVWRGTPRPSAERRST
jgi:hypothetical protein